TGIGGAVGWTYTVADNATDYLALNQTVTEIFAVKVSDNNGGFDIQNVTVTEDVAINGSGNLTDTGTVTFTDVDLTDTHTASVSLVSSTHGTALGALTLGSVTDTTGTGIGGAVGWTYTVADNATDYLTLNPTVSEIFAVKVSDNNGGFDIQNVTVTITGTNEAPV